MFNLKTYKKNHSILKHMAKLLITEMMSVKIHQHSLGGQVKWELTLQAKSAYLLYVLVMSKISFALPR